MDTLAKVIYSFGNVALGIVLMITWAIGWILSDNWWGIIPFYSWYVFLEQFMSFYHVLGYKS